MNRVKSLSKGGNSKEQVASLVPPAVKEVLAAQPSHVSADADDTYEQLQDFREDTYKSIVDNSSYDVCYNLKNPPDNYPTNHTFNARQEGLATSGGPRTERPEKKAISNGSTSQKVPLTSYIQYSSNAEQKVEKVSPPRRKTEKPGLSSTIIKQPMVNNSSTSNGCYNQNEPESPAYEDHIKDIVEEEKALIEAHTTVIEDTMEIVREEMKLLAEVDQPRSLIDNYVTKLSNVLSRKAASLVSIQSRLGSFQQRLKQQDVLTRKRVPR